MAEQWTKEERAGWSKHRTYTDILERLRKHSNLDLAAYIVRITAPPWDAEKSPMGFKFECNDPAGLYSKLLAHRRFGRDRVRKNEIREISQPNSLHIGVDHGTKLGNVHLDTISIAVGKEPDGRVIYAKDATVLAHVAKDLLHFDQGPIELPFTAPNPRDSLW